jgi:hypothetical protein
MDPRIVKAQEPEEIVWETPDLNKAIAKARLEVINPKFDSINPHFRSKFATLRSIIDAVIPTFARHGIGISQEIVTTDDGGVGCFTYLLHESGQEKVFGPFIVQPTKPDAQGQASASTYARRYSLQSVVGVVGQEDDDGEAASAWGEEEARRVANLLDAAYVTRLEDGTLDEYEDVEPFCKAWLALDQEKQAAFGKYVGSFWPGNVSKTKAHMRDVLAAYREIKETEPRK